MDWQQLESRLAQLVDLEVARGHDRTKHKFSLQTVHRLLESLALTAYPLPVIQIVGSKGKGTVAWLVEHLLRAHGWRTGLYQSPHFQTRRERVILNGEYASFREWNSVLEMLWETFEPLKHKVSRFEFETVLALELFVRADLDVVILEAGLGGKQDATSSVTPDVIGLTSIELEHTEILGSRLQDIARQKVGGIRMGVPLVSAPLPAEAAEEVKSICEMREADITWVGAGSPEEYDLCLQEVDLQPTGCQFQLAYQGETWPTQLSLLGSHIPILTATAVGIVDALLQSLGLRFDPKALEALEAMKLPGRLQQLTQNPNILLDVAHTPKSVQNAVLACQQLKQQSPQAILLGLNEDKRINELLHILGQETKHLILVPNPGPRGCSTEVLREALINTTWVYSAPSIEIYDSVEQGWNALLRHTETHQRMGLSLGSFKLIGRIQELLNLSPLPNTEINAIPSGSLSMNALSVAPLELEFGLK